MSWLRVFKGYRNLEDKISEDAENIEDLESKIDDLKDELKRANNPAKFTSGDKVRIDLRTFNTIYPILSKQDCRIYGERYNGEELVVIEPSWSKNIKAWGYKLWWPEANKLIFLDEIYLLPAEPKGYIVPIIEEHWDLLDVSVEAEQWERTPRELMERELCHELVKKMLDEKIIKLECVDKEFYKSPTRTRLWRGVLKVAKKRA